MKRRNFVKQSTLLAFSVSALGNISWNGKNFAANSPTTTDILGPFYRPDAPIRSNIIPQGSKGELLNLSGTIFQLDGQKPISDALIEIWQCDENEHYDNTSDEYLFRGAQKTDKKGKYFFKTIVPVPYKASETNWRPAHIHLRISSPGHQDLISQIYFKGDPHLKDDTSSAAPQASHRILEIYKNNEGVHCVDFNIVMQKNFPLDPEVFLKVTGLYKMEKGNIEFTKQDDLLFMKRNGQLVEALVYKGNNTFEGGLGYIRAKFDLKPNGTSEVALSMGNYGNGNLESRQTMKGTRFLKYSN